MILRGWLSQVLRLQSTTKSDALTADSRLMRRVPTRRMPQAFATLGVGSEKVDARVVVVTDRLEVLLGELGGEHVRTEYSYITTGRVMIWVYRIEMS